MGEFREKWITFLRPGGLLIEEEVRRVDADTTLEQLVGLCLPYEFAFRIRTVVQLWEMVDRTMFTHTLEDQIDPATYYIGGTIYTIEDVGKRFPHRPSFVVQMKYRGLTHMILTRTDNWQPFYPERDHHLPDGEPSFRIAT